MRGMISLGIGAALVLAVVTSAAAANPPAKAPPACAAINFRPLPQGMPDGEQQAGLYKSRHARLELRAEVKGGNPTGYYLTTGGKRMASAPTSLPEAAIRCASAKKMPKPEAPAASCTGQRFTAVVAHAGDQRLALLYAQEANSWRFCSAGSF